MMNRRCLMAGLVLVLVLVQVLMLAGCAAPGPMLTEVGAGETVLRFHVGLKDGELIAPIPPNSPDTRPLAFRAGMQTSDIVALCEGLYSRGGSGFTLDKVEPAGFIGQAGFRFEFSAIRQSDDLRLRGVADAEAVARSARVR